jgi:hypothetical protein
LDIEDEARKFKILLRVGIVMRISGIYRFSDLRYLVWGKTCDARIVNCYEDKTDSRNSVPHTAVVYRYLDGSEERQDSGRMPLGWTPPPGNKIQIQYIPGRDYASRFAGQSNTVSVWIFFACCAVVGYFIVRIILEERATRPKPPVSRRY